MQTFITTYLENKILQLIISHIKTNASQYFSAKNITAALEAAKTQLLTLADKTSTNVDNVIVVTIIDGVILHIDDWLPALANVIGFKPVVEGKFTAPEGDTSGYEPIFQFVN